MNNDEQWLRDELADAVPPPPTSGDRLAGIAEHRRRRQRRVAAGAVLATCLTVAAATFAGRAVLGDDSTSGPATPGPTEETSTTADALPTLDCPRELPPADDGGPGELALGAVAVRLCFGEGGFDDVPAPPDTLQIGLDSLVTTINEQARGVDRGCLGGFGPLYLLLVQYPDGSVRHVQLSLTACGAISVGDVRRQRPDLPVDEFARLLRQQRASSAPPAATPEPRCLPQFAPTFPVAHPDEMVGALLCVSYGDGSSRTSVPVPGADLVTILDALRRGERTPVEKGSPCSPTTPTWVLSGVTAWGDPVQITAECDRPSDGEDWVELPPDARDVVNRLIREASVQVASGDGATTAWSLAAAWLDAVNARAIVSYYKSAEEIGRIANRMWVGEPWLPDGELDWDLLAASEIEVSGWQFAWRIPARTPTGEAVFTVVRDSKDDPWRILSLVR